MRHHLHSFILIIIIKPNTQPSPNRPPAACCLNKCPALDSFHNEILPRGQGLIGICAARLRSSLIQISIQPQAKLSATKQKNKFRLGICSFQAQLEYETHSPDPMDRLSWLPLMKYRFSPVQWNTLKLGLNLNSRLSPVP